MAVRFEKTKSGDEIAIMPRRDYESLLAKAAAADEDLGTAKLAQQGRAEIASGAPLLPLAVADRLADGENPLKVMREWRDETQLHLAFLTGISQSHISDIESGRRVGTISTLRKLAAALRVPLDLVS